MFRLSDLGPTLDAKTLERNDKHDTLVIEGSGKNYVTHRDFVALECPQE